ncbi:hypothetical protein [Microbacterium pygmaeum]|uniref:Uncharacterized protein n=1 Tax=Microbacterium pygmaeum TaxID=370764 RepID=A0A1G7VT20_9MICO|nr:hypothetical protein [Microbacterium pygmaeum]SDG62952.1 hypothetical protein SAMN04489810_0825 [Microbacterium pygmaeum]
MMDAATRDELTELRRRAYGPAPDIDADPEALARLTELEDLALPARPEQTSAVPEPEESARAVAVSEPETSRVSGAPVAEVAPVAGVTPVAEVAPVAGSTPVAGSRRRIPPGRWGIAGVVAAGVATLMVAGFLTSGGVASPQAGSALDAAEIHVPVMIMASTGGYVDLSTIESAPDFPIRGAMSWAQPLGEHYGWSLWIGGADAGRRDQSCLLLTDGERTRGRCVSLDARTQGELVVSLPFDRIAPERRPTGMTPDQSVRFTWSENGFVTVVVRAPETL